MSGTQTDEQAIRVVAIISTFNEADVIGHVIKHLVDSGVEVYVIDNRSTDDTVAEAKKWLGRGVLDVERFPTPAGDGLFRWQAILDRKLAIAAEIRPDWIIHHDADEIRHSPWPNTPLREAIVLVDRHGFNAIDFRLLNFPPVDDAFAPGTDPRAYFTRYEQGPERDRIQVKCWKWSPDASFLDGGHDVGFLARRCSRSGSSCATTQFGGRPTDRGRSSRSGRAGSWTRSGRPAGTSSTTRSSRPCTSSFATRRRCELFDLDSVRLDVQLERASAGGGAPERSPDARTRTTVSSTSPAPERSPAGHGRRTQPDDPVDVDLWASDQLLGTVRADSFREDLRESGIGSGEHAFTFQVPKELREYRRYCVWANIAGTAIGLQRSPLMLERRAND